MFVMQSSEVALKYQAFRSKLLVFQALSRESERLIFPKPKSFFVNRFMLSLIAVLREPTSHPPSIAVVWDAYPRQDSTSFSRAKVHQAHLDVV